MDAPKKGQKLRDYHGERHEIGCSLHRAQSPIGTEERIDPETGEPRKVPPARIIHPDGTVETITSDEVAQFPVYGKDVGYQPDCPACRAGELNTFEHAETKRIGRERGEREQLERMRLFVDDNPDWAVRIGIEKP